MLKAPASSVGKPITLDGLGRCVLITSWPICISLSTFSTGVIASFRWSAWFGDKATKTSPPGAGKANRGGINQDDRQHPQSSYGDLPSGRFDERYHSQKNANDGGNPKELFVESSGELNPATRTSHACPAADLPDK